MSIIDDLRDDAVWDSLLDRKRAFAKDYSDIIPMQSFIKNRSYRPIVEAIADGTYVFGDPYVFNIPKKNGGSRRVFSVRKGDDVSEFVVIQMITKLLKKYLRIFSPNLYSISTNGSVNAAMNHYHGIQSIEGKFILKMDITDYGNSINVDKLVSMLEAVFEKEDGPILRVLVDILNNKNAILVEKGVHTPVVIEQKGVMPGIPVASFYTSLYLNELDWHYKKSGKDYFRYNDDILIVCDSPEDVEEQKNYVCSFITDKGLSMNEKKIAVVQPNEVFDFLGLEIKGQDVYITDRVVKRYKEKFRVRAKKIRMKINNGVLSRDEGFEMMLEFIRNSSFGNFSFLTIYFPRITSSINISSIDAYAQHYLRFVYTGKFSRRNNSLVPYKKLTDLGYLPVVSAYRIYRGHRYIRADR